MKCVDDVGVVGIGNFRFVMFLDSASVSMRSFEFRARLFALVNIGVSAASATPALEVLLFPSMAGKTRFGR